MVVSLPSREVYSVDVPEIKRFEAQFVYNFFVSDESTSETGGIPSAFLQRSGTEIDTGFMQYALTRAARYVTFTFSKPQLTSPGRFAEASLRENALLDSNIQRGSLISDNIDKVVTEDDFAVGNFVAVSFNDSEIDDKVHYLVSGSFVQHTLDDQQEHDLDVSHTKAAAKLHALLPQQIKPHLAYKALTLPSRGTGARFYAASGKRLTNQYFRRLKEVTTSAQINSKLFHGITGRTIQDPYAQFTTEMQSTHQLAKKAKNQVSQRSTAQVSDDDYKTYVPFVSVHAKNTAHHSDHRGPQIVGYIIDKVEHLENGQTRAHAPIIIDNPHVTTTTDFRVKYNATYTYSVRTVAQFTIPAIDDDTGDVAMLKVLVSSKPSTRVNVRTVELVAPPPPTDLSFTWDYERINPTTADHDPETGTPLAGTGIPGSLMVHWTFPPNSQRDIKKFQVFRRQSVDHPFELIKVYDFDDSDVRVPDKEQPDPTLVERLSSPATFYFDDDFTVDSRYMYAVCSCDAHGLTSAYSSQFEIWFDQFKNRLNKRLVSHAGAPKPYPNMYLEADAFVDTIKVSGPNSKRMRLYFNPEFYYVYDDENRMQPVIATTQRGGSYRVQFINVDSQKSVTINVNIDDHVRSTDAISRPEVLLGKPKNQRSVPVLGK